jgi:hypothetical protein
MTTKANELCDRIANVIRKDDDPADVLNALVDLYAFQMSLMTCPHCRKQAARALKQCIPAMLAHANRIAAEYASEGVPERTCH